MTIFTPILANGAEVIIWIALAIGWVIVQAMIKNSRKDGGAPSESSDGSPQAELDEFLQQIAGRAEESKVTEPSRSAPHKTQSAPVSHAKAANAHKARLATAIAEKSTLNKTTKAKKPIATPAIEPSYFDSAASANKSTQGRKWLHGMKGTADWRRAIVLREVLGSPKSLQEIEASTPGMGG